MQPAFCAGLACDTLAEEFCCADQDTYCECALSVRKLLWLRVSRKQGADNANMALAVHDSFVRTVLLGQRSDGKKAPPNLTDARQVCLPGCMAFATHLVAMLSCKC